MKKFFLYLITFLISFSTLACKKNSEYIIADYDVYEDTEEEDVPLTESHNKINVYVCGAVITPGVYKVDIEAIKEDAINAAGGFAEGASQEYVNLAKRITDGEQIYVPYESELEDLPVYNMQDSSSVSYSNGVYSSDGRLNINKASKEDLMTLNGIGETRAEAIIAYRDSHGLFNSVDEIMNVSGIKEGVYNNIKDYITLN